MGEKLEITAEQRSLLLDLRTRVEELQGLVNQAVELADEGKHGALVVLDVAPRSSFEVVKTLIAVRKAFGIYRDGMEKP